MWVMGLCRQRFINDKTSLEDLIRTHLPMECVEELIPVAKAHNEVIPKPKHTTIRSSQRVSFFISNSFYLLII